MAIVVKGILSFPKVFVPKVPKAGGDPKYSVAVLLEPNHPQLAELQQLIETAKRDQWPSGAPAGLRVPLNSYDSQFAGKEYYDARLAGYWVLSATAKADDKPSVVYPNHQPVVDPGDVYAGVMAYVHLGISAYTKGVGGVGGWLNGIMLTTEEPPLGRLDGKPSVDQMFAGVAPGAAQSGAPAPAPTAAPAPAPAAPVAPTAPVAPAHQMTPAATTTYEAYKAAGWTDDALVQNGLMVAPVAPSWQ